MSKVFSDKAKSTVTSELVAIINNPRQYDEKFVLASLRELQSRGKLDLQHADMLRSLSDKEDQENRARQYKSHLVPPDLPNEIKVGAFLLYTVLIVELIGIVFFNRSSEYSMFGIRLPGGLLSLGIGIFIHLGKSWARYVLYAMFIISTLFFVIAIEYETAIDYIQQLLILSAVVLVSMLKSRNWFNGIEPITKIKANADDNRL